jgi:hypothetical protein
MAKGAQKPKQTIILSGKSWERQDGETEAEWDAFVRFRDKGLLGKRPPIHVMASELGFLPRTLYDYSNKWNWKDRLAAFDKHLDSVKIKKLEDQTATVKTEIFDSVMRLHRKFEALVDGLLDEAATAAAEATDLAARTYVDADGVEKALVIITFDPGTMEKLINMRATLNRELRTAVGLPSTISANKINHEHNVAGIADFVRDRQKQLKAAKADQDG